MSVGPTAILWDIDGTLLRASGAGVRAFVQALATVTGMDFPKADMDMGGRTDPEIARRILQFAEAVGDHDDLADRMLIEIAAIYATNELEYAEHTVALPGVHRALDALHELGAVQTVVTGNIEPIARMKVMAAGVAERLQLGIGGYGSDHHMRVELVHTASRRIAEAHGAVDPRSVWIVGDTPRDLHCARAAGVRCMLVATGTNDLTTLSALDADAVFADLTDLDAVLRVIAEA